MIKTLKLSIRFRILALLCLSMILITQMGCTGELQNFSIDGNSIRNLEHGLIGGKEVLFISELDGSVSCYSPDGTKLWRQPVEKPAILFELRASDLNADGNDELLTAGADGYIRCWGSKGDLLWEFNPGHRVLFNEVAVLEESGSIRIFAGGNDYTLYELNHEGKMISKTRIEGTVRKIEAGNFVEQDKASLFLMTYVHDKYRWDFMGFLDPETKEVIHSIDYDQEKYPEWDRLMVTDMDIGDIDGDRRDDILFFGTSYGGGGAMYFGFNGELEEIARFEGPGDDRQRYAHVYGTSLLPEHDEILLQFGGIMYLCSSSGELLHRAGEPHRGIIFNDLLYLPGNGLVVGGGQTGGGNGLYFYHTGEPEWWAREHTLTGRLAEVQENLDILYRQTLEFSPPEYQKPSEKEWRMICSRKFLPEVESLNFIDVILIEQRAWKEGTDRSHLVEAIGEDALKLDRRGRYDQSREEIIALAAEFEREGTPFTVWAGHGNDPFYIQIETLEKILETAPNTCYGFVYAEMHNTKDPRTHYFIDHYMPRLAKALRKNGKAKLYFRYKNMFWAASIYQDPWKEMFLSGKYSDILVPSAEDTSNRIQDLNFAGRVGMFCGGFVDNFAMRLVDDNPTSWRPYTPGGQRSYSPYLRNGVIMAAYGSSHGIIFSNSYIEEPGINILYALMKSGALPLVEKEDVLSIGSWHLIRDIDEELVHSVDNHHYMKQFSHDDENAVFSVAQMHWAGTDVPDHDFSKAALGVEYRWLNFMPPMPHGMVPIAPAEYAGTLEKKDIPYSVANGKSGYIEKKPVPAKEFGRHLSSVVKSGIENLPVIVNGASWSAIRLDPTHIRLVLVDPGYIDPRDRDAGIRFQGSIPYKAVDILSGEDIPIDGNTASLTVPAGSIRLVDLSYE